MGHNTETAQIASSSQTKHPHCQLESTGGDEESIKACIRNFLVSTYLSYLGMHNLHVRL